MGSGMDWFRWHHGSVSDPKFQLVARRSGARVAEVLAVWASLLEAASQAEPRGAIGVPDFEAMDCALGLDDGVSARIFKAMEARELVDGAERRIAAWDRRQPKREDDSAGRTRAYRERKKHGHGDAPPADATQADAATRTVTHGDARGEERREELTPPVSPSAAADGDAAPVPTDPEPATKRRPRADSLTLPVWLAMCKAKGEKAMPNTDPVYAYAVNVGLPSEMLWLAWQAFKRRYAPLPKRYRDWRMVFRRAVEENWLRLWLLKAGEGFMLTTQGLQAKLAIEAEMAERV